MITILFLRSLLLLQIHFSWLSVSEYVVFWLGVAVRIIVRGLILLKKFSLISGLGISKRIFFLFIRLRISSLEGRGSSLLVAEKLIVLSEFTVPVIVVVPSVTVVIIVVPPVSAIPTAMAPVPVVTIAPAAFIIPVVVSSPVVIVLG